jgi:transcription-repair coupling factor (superfamily II helicase)
VRDAIGAQKWHTAAGLLEKRPALVIAPSELRAKEIHADLSYFFPSRCHAYPARDMLFYAADVKSNDITRQRLAVLEALREGGSPIVVLSAPALLDRMTPPATFHKYRLALNVGDSIEPATLHARLAQMGYTRAPVAEGPGQFAVRGGICDIYPCAGASPVRLEFFDIEIDSIRTLDAHSQRSVDNVQTVELTPVHELVFSQKRMQAAVAAINKACEAQQRKLSNNGYTKEAATLKDFTQSQIDQWDGQPAATADAFLPFFYEEETSLLDYLRKDTMIFLDDPNAIATHMQNARQEYDDSLSHRLAAGRMLPEQADVLLTWGQILHRTGRFSRVLFSSLTGKLDEFDENEITTVELSPRPVPPLRSKPAELTSILSQMLKNGTQVAILAGPRRSAEAMTRSLNDDGIPARMAEDLGATNLAPGVITVARGALSQGFELPAAKLAVITGADLFSETKTRKAGRKRKDAQAIAHFTDLRIGDYVVHESHGIGVFRGIEQVTSDGNTRDYLKLEYADGGNLYVQTSQMDLVQKYIGKEETKLNKLGGESWAKAKARTRAAVEILAKDLIFLYAQRQATIAHEYPPDTVWQQEFEATFLYEETEDQLNAIEDVKRDMQSARVMDRLICGDVGYGKTEVAIRAAFKAVQDGKQVAYLVPTTILAQQHYQTFCARMGNYPVAIHRLSRFQTAKEQKQTIKDMASGAADIVIGTHRLLSKDVKFKSLGLIIVDEEQRFGVGHKEKLKHLRANVDVLTLTATPIPRTLHFSMSGIRDMSLISEPPEKRRPVQTYVMEQNPEFVRDAINRELARGGQVFYLHNRVANIAEEAHRVAQLVPQARVAFAHGQMSETELEDAMHDFVAGDVDVLVCTTIVESGLDIPNVNTIIIQNADHLGLAQLYQLRGRVGRSHRLAYAYLMYRRDKVLREEAEKRLSAIREFTEFGAGFKIAMRDLEIRGAGNLLGAEQHGHMGTVGYEMYVKLLNHAVRELKGEQAPEVPETTVDITADAHIPARFIPDEFTKLEIYKKIALINSQEAHDEMRDEIEDRFGKIPAPVTNLLNIALMKAHARTLGTASIIEKPHGIVITFRRDASVDMEKLTEQIMAKPALLHFSMTPEPTLTIRTPRNAPPPTDGGAARIAQIQTQLVAICNRLG